MDSRLDRYIRMQIAFLTQSRKQTEQLPHSLSVLQSLTPEEGNALDSNGTLPIETRLIAISNKVGCPVDEIVRILQGYLYQFGEGLKMNNK